MLLSCCVHQVLCYINCTEAQLPYFDNIGHHTHYLCEVVDLASDQPVANNVAPSGAGVKSRMSIAV